MSIKNVMPWVLILAVFALVSVSAQEPMSLATATAMARVTKKVAPDYPAAARQLNVSGQQEISVTVGVSGDVEEAKVLKGNAMFSANSLSAVRQWKFTPLAKDGAPTKFTTVVVINYQK
ncbi:MAG: energy transducer TonB [Acidobacteria bacterium]|nr:energy transducer TonB [Acidobacteriota bacterium]